MAAFRGGNSVENVVASFLKRILFWREIRYSHRRSSEGVALITHIKHVRNLRKNNIYKMTLL